MLPILPETRVNALLEAYPRLEEVLIEMAPAFGKLRNPILRKTIGRVATLRRAADIAGIPIETLVERLRAAVGQPVSPITTEGDGSSDTHKSAPEPAPDWVADAAISATMDAEAILAGDGNPLGQLQQMLKDAKTGDVLCVLSTFRPAPLIEVVENQGCETHTIEESPGKFRTLILNGNSTATERQVGR